MCKKPSELRAKVECPKGWKEDTEGRCYFLSSEHVGIQTAKEMCPKLSPGAKLVLPLDDKMNDFVHGLYIHLRQGGSYIFGIL